MSSGGPTREQADLAEVLEMVLDKGIVINADVAITVGETELLGIELRAAIASFETAAKYGLAFPSGTDMRRVEQASGRQSLEDGDITPIDLGIEASSGGSAAEDEDEGDEDSEGSSSAAPGRRPTPTVMAGSVGDEVDEGDEGAGGDEAEHESDADGGDAVDDDIDDAEVDGDDVEADADDAGPEDDDADADDQDGEADGQDADAAGQDADGGDA